MATNPAITISRCLGSGGTEVGLMVARGLGWSFCDRCILRLAAETLGRARAGLAAQEERHCGFLEQMMNILSLGSPEACYTPILDLPLYSRDLYEAQREVILRLVARAPSVLVGRGGFVALRGRPETLHVSLGADPEFRVRRLLERGMAASPEAARAAIEASDRERAAFIRDISGLDWHAPRNFDLVLDASRDGLEACAARIAAEARRRFPGPGLAGPG